MTSDEINAAIKRLCLNQQLSSTVLALVQAEAISQLGHLLVAAAPEYFEKKKSLANGGTNLFAMPSDCLMLKKVWDYGGNVGTVSGAAASPAGLIRITHNIVIPDDPSSMTFPLVFPFGFAAGITAVVTIHDVAGCTEANGTFGASYVDATHIDLYGTTFVNAYTSGGKIFIESPDIYEAVIERTPAGYETADDDTRYFYRNDDLVVDDPDFRSDIIALYRYAPSALTEIPARMHMGIYAYGVIALIELNDRRIKVGDQFVESAEYATKKKNLEFCKGLWERATEMASGYRPVGGTNNISDRKPKRCL
jgi:hypothetical protein